jgi:TPR repeat protein
MSHKFIIALLGICLAGCVNKARVPTSSTKPILFIEGINQSSQEREALMKKVRSGDAEAALTLGEYFALVAKDDVQAAYWFKKAAILGGDKEKRIYNSFIEE